MPPLESAIISEPINIFFTDSFTVFLCIGLNLPSLALTFIVLKPRKYNEINFLTIDDASSCESISITASSFFCTLDSNFGGNNSKVEDPFLTILI